MINTQHFSKIIDLRLQAAIERNDASDYLKARLLRLNTSPFDKYRIKLMRHLLKRINLAGRTLDIGCNIGFLAESYLHQSNFIVLCDKDYFVLKVAQEFNQQGRNKIKYICADIKNLPFKQGCFNTVVTLETIEHIFAQEQRSAFDGFVRITAAGANIVLSTPNQFSLAGLEGKIMELLFKQYRWDAWDKDHKFIYRAIRLRRFLENFSSEVKLTDFWGSYFLSGSSLVRLPLILQQILGFLSYLVARFMGRIFPFKYIGFTSIAICKKEKDA